MEISPMVWRRVLVPATTTLRELHGVFQVAMGWEGIHLFQFRLRAACYGSAELSAASPDVMLADLRFRKSARFLYEYDLNIPWRHEVRLEDQVSLVTTKPGPTDQRPSASRITGGRAPPTPGSTTQTKTVAGGNHTA
jgi:hypothetical protein